MFGYRGGPPYYADMPGETFEQEQERRQNYDFIEQGVQAGLSRTDLNMLSRQWCRMMRRARQPDYFPKACLNWVQAGYTRKTILDEVDDSGNY